VDISDEESSLADHESDVSDAVSEHSDASENADEKQPTKRRKSEESKKKKGVVVSNKKIDPSTMPKKPMASEMVANKDVDTFIDKNKVNIIINQAMGNVGVDLELIAKQAMGLQVCTDTTGGWLSLTLTKAPPRIPMPSYHSAGTDSGLASAQHNSSPQTSTGNRGGLHSHSTRTTRIAFTK
jgi:hypothetical protein